MFIFDPIILHTQSPPLHQDSQLLRESRMEGVRALTSGGLSVVHTSNLVSQVPPCYRLEDRLEDRGPRRSTKQRQKLARLALVHPVWEERNTLRESWALCVPTGRTLGTQGEPVGEGLHRCACGTVLPALGPSSKSFQRPPCLTHT